MGNCVAETTKLQKKHTQTLITPGIKAYHGSLLKSCTIPNCVLHITMWILQFQ